MKKQSFLVAVMVCFFLLGIFFIIKTGPSITGYTIYQLGQDRWWNSSWHYRLELNVSASANNLLIDHPISNLTTLLTDAGCTNNCNVDLNSLRVVDTENDVNLPYGFKNETPDSGTLYWLANVSLSKTFYLYFDTIDFPKPAEEQMIIWPYWRSSCSAGLNTTSSDYSRSWDVQAVEVKWNWSDLINGEDISRIYIDSQESWMNSGPSESAGGNVSLFLGSTVTGQYEEGGFGNPGCTSDAYGNFGLAIDRIMFLPTTSYNNESFSVTQGNAERNSLNLTTQTDKSLYGLSQYLTLNGTIKDLNEEGVNATIYIDFYYPNQTFFQRNTTSSDSNGYFEFILLLYSPPFDVDGEYVIETTASKEHFINMTINRTVNISANFAPEFSNLQVTPSSEGWGSNYTYSFNISDFEDDDVSFSHWVNTSGGWINYRSIILSPSGQTLIETHYDNFSCSDIGTRSYRYQYNDSSHQPQNLSVQTGPTLTKDSLSLLYYQGDNEIINRSGNHSSKLSVLFNDTTSNNLVSGQSVEFWSTNGSWNFLGNSTTNSSGVSAFDYDPGCGIVPNQYSWKANFTGACYLEDESLTYDYTVMASFNHTLYAVNNSYRQEDQVKLNTSIKNDCGNPVTNVTVQFNLSTSSTSYLCDAEYSGEGYYNCTWDSTLKEVGTYNITILSSKSYYNEKETTYNNQFTLSPGPPKVYINLSSTVIEQESVMLVNVTVIDTSRQGIQNVELNISSPAGSSETVSMTNTSDPVVNISYWITRFPEEFSIVDSGQTGQYNLTVTATDNVPVEGSTTDSFKVFTKNNASLYTLKSSYSQGEYGSVYYRLYDINNNSINQANITLTIEGQNKIYFMSGESYITDSDGEIGANSFLVPSDMPVGGYVVYSYAEYYDSTISAPVYGSANYTFQVTESAGSGGITAELEIPEKASIEQGFPVELNTKLQANNEPVNVDNITIHFYNVVEATGSLSYWFNITKADMQQVAGNTGFYNYFEYNSSLSNNNVGSYVAVAKIEHNGMNTTVMKHFTLTLAPQYDFNLVLDSDSVEQCGRLDFQITATNVEGEPEEDSKVEWFIGEDAENSSYYGSAQQKTPSMSPWVINESFTMDAEESLGTKTVYAFIYYPFDANTWMATASRTFMVTEGDCGAQPAGGGDSETTESVSGSAIEKEKKLDLVNYPQQIFYVRDSEEPTYFTVTVKNSGNVNLNKLKLDIEGLMSYWITMQSKDTILEPGEVKVLSLQLEIPRHIKAGDFPLVAKITAEDGPSVEFSSVINVFESKYELYLYKIQLIESELQLIKVDYDELKEAGKNVTVLNELIVQIEKELEVTKLYQENKLYPELVEKIFLINKLIQEANEEVDNLKKPIIERPEPRKVPLSWFIVVSMLLVSGVAVSAITLTKGVPRIVFEKSVEEEINKREQAELKRINQEREKIQKKRKIQKIKRMMSILDEQYQNKKLTEESYLDIKKANEQIIKNLKG